MATPTTSADFTYELLRLTNTRGDISEDVRELLLRAIQQAHRELAA